MLAAFMQLARWRDSTNSHCLIPDFDTAKQLDETGRLKDSEPGPLQNLRGVHPRIEAATT
jgi:hypothetical protein